VTNRQPSQKEALRARLVAGEKVTPLDALDQMGSFRLGARVYELRREGMEIVTQMVKTPGGATVAQYSLAQYQHPLV
jgi:hypothetical protein